MKFPIALKIRAKNGILQKFIDQMGWTQEEFARKLGIHQSTVCAWFNMKACPNSHIHVDKITELIGKPINEIFPDILKTKAFRSIKKRNTLYKEVDLIFLPSHKMPELSYIPEDKTKFEICEMTDNILKALQTLKPKEEQVIKKRFGIGEEYLEGKTLRECSKIFGVSSARIRQIESRALRKLRHPRNTKILKNLI